MSNKIILEKANAAIRQGDYEGFLACCHEQTTWNFVGDRILRGKNAVRQYMKESYIEPPRFTVTNMIAEGDHVVAIGSITVKDEQNVEHAHLYCDVWQFKEGLMAELTAFVIKQ